MDLSVSAAEQKRREIFDTLTARGFLSRRISRRRLYEHAAKSTLPFVELPKDKPAQLGRNEISFRLRPRLRSKVKAAHLPSLLVRDEFVPQAIINRPVEQFAGSPTHTFSGADDLDQYEGIGFYLGDVPVAVMHYKGHPQSTSTIYLPNTIRDLKRIGSLLRRILSYFKLPKEEIVWQRTDAPDL